jgi:hypothetical protein
MRFAITACTFIILMTASTACQITDGILSGRGGGDGSLRLTLEPADQTCESSEECVLVWTDCSTCDCGTPVNQRHQPKYRMAYQDLCADYQGPVCEMYCPPAELVCEQGMCIIVTEGSAE